MEFAASLALPAVFAALALIILLSKRDCYSEFALGAEQGISTAISLLPNFVLLTVAISMLGASGFPEFLARTLAPVGERLGVPIELLPLLVVRPLSGSASNAIIAELFDKYGADSFVGLCASVIVGSSDTLIYVVSVYFSAVNVKKTRYALPAAFAVMLFGVWFSCFLCRLFYK